MVRERVVIVDDDRNILLLIQHYLVHKGFTISLAEDGREALSVIEDKTPDIVILDIILPKLDGIEVLKQLREWSSVPVIALSARGAMDDKTRCLNLGADDYITKPFNLEELYARINAVLRRTQTQANGEATTFTCNRLFIDYEKHEVTVDGQRIQISPLEFNLLWELTSNAGRLLTHEYLLNTVWGTEYRMEREYLHVYIRQLRSKVERDPKNPELIITVPRVGYKFALDSGIITN